MLEANKCRTGWIDICKAVAIYCMVLGHTGTSDNISYFIHVFHMPVFFMLSGYCFNESKNSDLWELTKKRFKTLLIPYFVFGIGLFLLWDAVLYIMHRNSEIRSIQNLLISILWSNANASAFGVIQWFLPCLFFVEILFACLVKICKGKIFAIGGGIILISVIAYLLPNFKFRLPWALDCALMAILFYGLGWMARKLQLAELFKFIKKHLLASTIAAITLSVVLLPLVFLNGEVNMRTITYGNYFLYVFNAIAYSVVLIIISMIIEEAVAGKKLGNLLDWIGRNTLVVLLLNSTCVRAYEVVFGKFLYKLDNVAAYGINAVVAILITVFCAAASEFINRFCPYLIGKKRI